MNLRKPIDRFEHPILISARPRFPPERVKNLDRVSVCGPDRDRLRDAFDRISVPGPEPELLRGGAEAPLVLRPAYARLGFEISNTSCIRRPRTSDVCHPTRASAPASMLTIRISRSATTRPSAKAATRDSMR